MQTERRCGSSSDGRRGLPGSHRSPSHYPGHPGLSGHTWTGEAGAQRHSTPINRRLSRLPVGPRLAFTPFIEERRQTRRRVPEASATKSLKHTQAPTKTHTKGLPEHIHPPTPKRAGLDFPQQEQQKSTGVPLFIFLFFSPT